MGIRVKSTDGKSTGYVDVAAELQRQVPGATITNFDKDTGELSFKAGERAGRINVKQEIAARGAEIVGVEDLNSPEQAVDSSPLTWSERFELGYLTRESSDFKRLTGAVSALFGGKGTTDAEIAANEKRALGQLKKRYGDAKIVGGEMVVKHNGVWKKVDSSSDSIGEDAAQILGNTGLNILGAIAGAKGGALLGSAFGPAGTVVGGVGGAVAGTMLAEVAEEATAVGIVGGEVDPAGAARDIMTEGVLAMVGEGLGAGLSKAAGAITKMSPEAAARLAQADSIKAEATVVRGLSKFAEAADGKVKDMVAQTYSTINPELSEVPLREAIDNSANMVKAHRYSKVARSIPANAPNPLLRNMATGLQESLDKAYEINFKNFDGVLQKIQNTVTDDFKVDLEQTVIDLKAAAMDAPRDKREFFNSLENETADLVKGFKASSEEPVLSGKKAWAYTQRMYKMIHQKLKDVGAYEKQQQIEAGDRLLFNSMEKIRSYFDDKIMAASDFSKLTPEFEAQRNQFREVADMMGTIWSKSFSNKRDLTFAQNVAKGKVDPNVTEAIAELNRLIPGANIQGTLSDMRLMQAGIEMTPVFKVPDLIRSVGAAGAATTGGLPGVAAAATVASPRFAASQAHTVAKASGLTKQALSAGLPAARAKARSLMGMAYSAGFLRTLSHAQTRALIQNPELFEQWLNQSSQLTSTLEKASPEAVTEAAIKASQGAR